MGKRKRHIIWSCAHCIVAAGLFVAGGLILWAGTLKIPDLASLDERKIEQSTKIYDRTGEMLLYDVHENITRTVIPLSDMSRSIKNATVAIEDAEFYEHHGVKPTAIIRAMLVNIGTFGFNQGGSTITQQVVKNSVLTTEKTIARKLKEWILSLKLEQALSKEEILQLYLNEIPYGGSVYGIEEASRTFFGVSASELTLAQSAYLAALPQAPTFYSPYGNNRDRLEKRKDLVLSQMYDNGFITKDELESARAETIVFQSRAEGSIRAPHFVFFIQEYLENKYGRRAIEERGFRVITTLDYKLQEQAEEIVGRFTRENAKTFNAQNAGLVAIDPKTGHILVMVGSRDYFDKEIDGNFNITLAERQPGSAFKPFVYAAALKQGYTADTVVFDTQTQFSTACKPHVFTSQNDCYAPVNYDDTFRGPVTFRDALAQSINVPAVKALYLAGINDALKTSRDLGIQTLTEPTRYGLTLVLGGGEVRPLDITSAYGVFANRGIRNPTTGILRIEDGAGNVLEEFERKESRVLDEQIALTITDILSDNEARAPAFGQRSPLYFHGRDVAAKTGTTNNFRDAWIVGYTPNIAVGAWAGNNDNSPMAKQVAGFVIAPLWNEFMETALAAFPHEPFDKPLPDPEYNELKPILRGIWQGGETFVIDQASGKLATERTPTHLTEERAIPDVHSILTWVDPRDPRGPSPDDPSDDPQFTYWEFGVERWLAANRDIIDTSVTIPEDFDDVHGPDKAPKVSIENVVENQSFFKDERVTITIRAHGDFPTEAAELFINERFVGSSDAPLLSFSFIPQEIGLAEGTHTLRVVVTDTVGNNGMATTSFFIN